MDQQPKRELIERVLREVQKELQARIRSMELGSAAIGMQSARAANELRKTAQVWRDTQKDILVSLQGLDSLTLEQLDHLLDVFPPHRVIYRFNLERTTRMYEDICLDRGIELAELFSHAESAIDRGDYDIGMNLLNQTLKRDPRYFPGLLMHGVALLNTRDRAAAIRLFDRASNQPPFQDPDRYKMLALELLAHAYEQDDKPLNAIKTWKRLRKMETFQATMDYNIARNYAMSGQASDAITALDEAITARPALFALSLVDDDFGRVRKSVIQMLNEKNEEWGERTIQMLDKARQISEIAKGYELDNHEEAIGEGLRELDDMELSLEDGCYSVYKHILTERLPLLVQDLPIRIRSRLTREVDLRIDEIETHNQKVIDDARQQRNMFMRVGVPLWLGFSLVVTIMLLIVGQSPITAMFIGLLLMSIGYIPVRIINRIFQNTVQANMLPKDSMFEVNRDIRQVENVRTELMNRFRQEGIIVDHEDSKV